MTLKRNVKIMPHQQAAADKALANNGQVLLTHGVGLGKTLSSINIVDKLSKAGKSNKVLVVVPASLRTNFVENGVKKYTTDTATTFGAITDHATHIDDRKIPDSKYYVVSYDMFRKDPHKYLDRTKADTIIVDEMHNFRNPDTENYRQMMSVRGRVKNFIGLTGTPLNNHPYDVVPLVNIVSNGKHNLGYNKKQFSERYIRKVPKLDMYGKDTGELTESIVNRDTLKKELGRYVHHATNDDLNANDVPKKIIQNVDVEMSPLQQEQYKFVMKSVPRHIREQIREGMPVNRKEAFSILPKLQQARNVMNGVHYLNKNISLKDSAVETPKIKKALDDIQNHIAGTCDAQVIVSSNMLEGGCDVISAGLTARGIKHGLFTGKQSRAERDKAVKDYNSGKNKVIVLSSAGTTGLNLPNTTMHVALDPHYNPAVIHQIEARGIRAGGLKQRLPQDRKVIVRRYRSVNPAKWYQRMGIGRKDMSVDEWMYGIAGNKQDLNTQVDNLFSKSAAYLNGEGRMPVLNKVIIHRLHEDLKGEYDAIDLYQKHIDSFPAGKIKTKLIEIRDEEKHHVKELTELLLNKTAKYFYHGTPAKNIESIRDKGILGSKRGLNYDNPEGSSLKGNGVFLTSCKDYAKGYSVDLSKGLKHTISQVAKDKSEPLIVKATNAKKLYSVDNAAKGKPVDEYFKPGNVKASDIVFPDDPQYKEIDKSLNKKASCLDSMYAEYKIRYNID